MNGSESYDGAPESGTADFYLYLAAAIVSLRMFIRRAIRLYR
jgi:hypothetical protein